MRFKLVIFDCDGVLVDSEPVANRVFTQELNAIGVPMSLEDVCGEFIGRSMTYCMDEVERRLGRPAPAGFLERVQARTFDGFRAGLEAVPGVRDAIERIPAPICVASSGEPEKMRLTLGLTGLLPLFEGRLFSASEVERGKPHPDLFLFAAVNMQVAPEDCVVVEDSRPGVEAGVAAGMTVFGYDGRGNAAELADGGATVFDDMRRLPDLLDLP